MTDTEVLENLRILGVAGQETTASIMAWILIHLALYRDLWRELCREVVPNAPLPVSLRETQEFPFIKALTNEALRRYTPAWYVPRTIRADDLVLHGCHIPDGTVIGLSPLATHHLEELWPDPFRFDVGRWAGDISPSPHVFLPYGGGPHLCVGAAFAALQITQMLVAIAAARLMPVLEKKDYNLRPILLAFPHPSASIRVSFVSES
jgi:cytochrome P450 monooxygenase